MTERKTSELRPAAASTGPRYLERLLAAVAKSHDGALSPAESRLLAVASGLDMLRFVGLAGAETGAPCEIGKRLPDQVLGRAVDMWFLAAVQVESRLQQLRQDLEEHAKGGG